MDRLGLCSPSLDLGVVSAGGIPTAPSEGVVTLLASTLAAILLKHTGTWEENNGTKEVWVPKIPGKAVFGSLRGFTQPLQFS